MKFRELKRFLDNLTDEQLNNDISFVVGLNLIDGEYFGSGSTIKLGVTSKEESSVLDDGHPYIQICN